MQVQYLMIFNRRFPRRRRRRSLKLPNYKGRYYPQQVCFGYKYARYSLNGLGNWRMVASIVFYLN